MGFKFGYCKIFDERIFQFRDLFSAMFPDSDIVKRLQCGCTKVAYVAHFGLTPYFHELMLLDSSYISLSFDEFSNSSVQKGQMDIIIRFWEDLQLKMFYKHFLLILVILTSQRFWRLLQTNMNVFLKNLAESREEKELLPLLDIGRCGLHAIHNSFLKQR